MKIYRIYYSEFITTIATNQINPILSQTLLHSLKEESYRY